jgi:hypothetical protein
MTGSSSAVVQVRAKLPCVYPAYHVLWSATADASPAYTLKHHWCINTAVEIMNVADHCTDATFLRIRMKISYEITCRMARDPYPRVYEISVRGDAPSYFTSKMQEASSCHWQPDGQTQLWSIAGLANTQGGFFILYCVWVKNIEQWVGEIADRFVRWQRARGSVDWRARWFFRHRFTS